MVMVWTLQMHSKFLSSLTLKTGAVDEGGGGNCGKTNLKNRMVTLSYYDNQWKFEMGYYTLD
jgi:hypothetical protein